MTLQHLQVPDIIVMSTSDRMLINQIVICGVLLYYGQANSLCTLHEPNFFLALLLILVTILLHVSEPIPPLAVTSSISNTGERGIRERTEIMRG